MSNILIGTSGYSYTEWVGVVYPEGTKQSEFLRLYSEMFPTVELNFSYYSMPKAENLAKMVVNSGSKLTFSIKAHKTLTHEINPSLWQNEAKTFLSAIEPLSGSGRLEVVLFQFPYSFKYDEENRRYLNNVLKYFKDVPVAVEFRKADWCIPKVYEGMAERQIPLVSLDLPNLPKLPPTLELVTAPTAYVRLHGRNKEAWWGKDDHARYDYLYTDSEMQDWADRIQRIAERANRVLVYLNNHPFGKAVRNAQTLEKMLAKINNVMSGE